MEKGFQDGSPEEWAGFKYSTPYNMFTDESIDLEFLRGYDFKVGFIKGALKRRRQSEESRLRNGIMKKAPVFVDGMLVSKSGNSLPIKPVRTYGVVSVRQVVRKPSVVNKEL